MDTPPSSETQLRRSRDDGGRLTWIAALFSGGKTPADADAATPAGADSSGSDSAGGDSAGGDSGGDGGGGGD